MLNITKQEAEFLREKGLSHKVFHTWTKNKTYYCVEDNNIIKTLYDYRASKVLERHVREGVTY